MICSHWKTVTIARCLEHLYLNNITVSGLLILSLLCKKTGYIMMFVEDVQDQ